MGVKPNPAHARVDRKMALDRTAVRRRPVRKHPRRFLVVYRRGNPVLHDRSRIIFIHIPQDQDRGRYAILAQLDRFPNRRYPKIRRAMLFQPPHNLRSTMPIRVRLHHAQHRLPANVRLDGFIIFLYRFQADIRPNAMPVLLHSTLSLSKYLNRSARAPCSRLFRRRPGLLRRGLRTRFRRLL